VIERHPRAARARRGAALALLLVATAFLPALAEAPASTPHAARAKPRPRAASAADRAKSPHQLAQDARALEELGAYGEAAQRLRALRRRTARDADLELALALDEARAGQPDSAVAALWGPILSRALLDTLPPSRRHSYAWEREPLWLNGSFDGWPWYIARARAELAFARGEWAKGLESARLASHMHPMSGRDRLILALCAAHAGGLDEAAQAAHDAAWLDPMLPEANYLAGLFAWRAGRRVEAQSDFRAAVALDSSYAPAALALVRSRLPGIAPDSIPGELLTGLRRAGLLTSPVGPKVEEFIQLDTPASILKQELVEFPDSLKKMMRPTRLNFEALVDERGRAALAEISWIPAGALPVDALHLTLLSVADWRFQPGTRNGRPHRVWASLVITYDPTSGQKYGQ
jgi:hypothetical protein